MPKLETRWLVDLEGHGRLIPVVSDQRELAKREAADLPDGPHTSARFTAWAALVRQNLYSGTWQQFNDKDCIEVVNDPSVPVPDPEDEQGLDPGNPSTSATG
jgi:hypothetical protein